MESTDVVEWPSQCLKSPSLTPFSYTNAISRSGPPADGEATSSRILITVV
jgi:hypothetical protein